MTTPRFAIAAALTLSPAPVLAQAPAAPCMAVEEIATYPSPAFLENLYVEPSGRVLFTSYLARQVNVYRPGQDAETFASLDAFPISILPLGTGWLVAAHGAPFTEGPGFAASNQFLVLDTDGTLVRTIPAPEARFLNGMVAMENGSVLVADSMLGRIWRLDPESGEMTVWLEHPELAADPQGKDLRPGANGLKLHGGKLYLSNSFTGRINAVNIAEDGSAGGAPTLVAEPKRVDDFAITPSGDIYIATHSDTVLLAKPDGTIGTVLPSGGDGSTAVALVPGEPSALYVLTTGGLLEGSGRPARLLKLVLPGGGPICP